MGDVCKRHPQNVVIAKCIACGEDICRECRDEFGYFCSKECLMKTKGSVDPLHKAKVKKSVQAGMRMERILSASVKIVFLAILLAIAWFSYAFFFSPYGKLVWTWNGDVSSDCNITPFEQGKLALLLNGSSSLIFDAMKCRTHINLGNSSLKSLNFCAGQLGSSVLLQGEGSVGILAGNGALTWFK